MGEVHFYNTFEHLWFKKILVFENVFLTKVIHFYVMKNMNTQ
jgi:hypothetical protein